MATALYRKYRPSDFDGVLGQEHITETLKNQIRLGKVGHSYLFCGSRGVGKTSLARIFAHAVNCENPEKAPCGQCSACKKGYDENNLDIIEIDAASNNGVDDARELREKVKYPPVVGKYKVYIIDEAHMLSSAAFNALLKTLEEPPSYIIFILATTESHKLPATILSRCMRFDFKLLPMDLLTEHLADIYEKEGKQYETEALRAIAAAAEGSVRDALSIADLCLNLSRGKLTLRDVDAALGAGDEKSRELLIAVLDGKIKESLTLLNALEKEGKNMSVVAKELASYARDLMVAKSAPDILETTNERKRELMRYSERYSLSGLAALVTLFSAMDNELRYSLSPTIAMEAAIIRAVNLYAPDYNALDARLLRLENAIKSGVRVAEKTEEAAPQTDEQPDGKRLWGQIISYFRKNSPPQLTQIVGHISGDKVKLAKETLTIYCNRGNYLSMCDERTNEELRRALLSLGRNYRIAVEKDPDDIDLEKEVANLTQNFGSDVKIIK